MPTDFVSVLELRDLALPPTPGLWPLAPGWWLLAALLLLAVGLAWRWYRRRQQQRRPYQLARQQLLQLSQAWQAGRLTHHTYLDASNTLLKQLCLHVRGQTEVAVLWGEPWLQWLDHAMGEPVFSQGPGQALGDLRLQPQVQPDAALPHLLLRLLQHWERQPC